MPSVGLDRLLPLLILEHDLELVIAAPGRVLGPPVGVQERDLESAEVLFDERRRVQGRVIGSGFRQLVQLDPVRQSRWGLAYRVVDFVIIMAT